MIDFQYYWKFELDFSFHKDNSVLVKYSLNCKLKMPCIILFNLSLSLCESVGTGTHFETYQLPLAISISIASFPKLLITKLKLKEE